MQKWFEKWRGRKCKLCTVENTYCKNKLSLRLKLTNFNWTKKTNFVCFLRFKSECTFVCNRMEIILNIIFCYYVIEKIFYFVIKRSRLIKTTFVTKRKVTTQNCSYLLASYVLIVKWLLRCLFLFLTFK